MKYEKYILIMVMLLIFFACGDPAVDIEDVNYDPKIVVEAVISPGEKIEKVRLMRNFPLETDIDSMEMFLDPEVNNVNASINGTSLQYDEFTQSYFCGLIPEYDKEYTLTVSATIDGTLLGCSSTTRTPSQGFEVVNRYLGTIKYREDKAGIMFYTSPGTDSYVFSIRPEGATLDNFIYDNPFVPDIKREDLEENFGDFLYEFAMIININSYSDKPVNYEVNELDMWFYTDYRIIAYAADKNFRDYLITAGSVQEPDGNFVHPVLHFEGDGIGVFGSAVKDTLGFKLVK